MTLIARNRISLLIQRLDNNLFRLHYKHRECITAQCYNRSRTVTLIHNNAYELPTAVFLTLIPHELRIFSYTHNAYPGNVVQVFRYGG